MTASAIAFSIALLLPAGAATPSPPATTISAALKSVVVISTATGEGSGFFVRPHEVLTAAHVVAGTKNVQVRLGATEEPGHVVGADAGVDLALVDVDIDAPILTFQTAEPEPGTPLVAIGDPLGGGTAVTRGIVSSFREVNGRRMLQTDAAINPGNSGGPLVSEGGRVLGVVVSKLRNADGIGLAVPAQAASAFIGGTAARGTSGGDTTGTASRNAPRAVTPRASTTPVLPWALGATGVAVLLLSPLLLAHLRRRPKLAPEIEIVLHHPSTRPYNERS